MTLKHKVLQQLSDGHFHSGQSLGESHGVSRAAIWKVIQQLQQEYEINIQSVTGRGYRLAHPIELLDVDQIIRKLSSQGKSYLKSFEVLSSVDSSNEYLLKAASQGQASGTVVLAEQQKAGRGRRGRTWVSPFGRNLYLSLLWRFDLSMQDLSALGIAVAVAVTRALSQYSSDLKIKWPNDIFWQGKKLAGILLEVQGETQGPVAVVIGVGVNIGMTKEEGSNIDQDWVDLTSIYQQPVSRQQVASTVIDELIKAVNTFEQNGLSPFHKEWASWDMLQAQQVVVSLGEKKISGVACGINENGAILIEIDGKLKAYMAGEVSLRPQQTTASDLP